MSRTRRNRTRHERHLRLVPPPPKRPATYQYGALRADDRGELDARRIADGWIPRPYCTQPLVEETDGTFCGGCGLAWARARRRGGPGAAPDQPPSPRPRRGCPSRPTARPRTAAACGSAPPTTTALRRCRSVTATTGSSSAARPDARRATSSTRSDSTGPTCSTSRAPGRAGRRTRYAAPARGSAATAASSSATWPTSPAPVVAASASPSRSGVSAVTLAGPRRRRRRRRLRRGGRAGRPDRREPRAAGRRRPGRQRRVESGVGGAHRCRPLPGRRHPRLRPARP